MNTNNNIPMSSGRNAWAVAVVDPTVVPFPDSVGVDSVEAIIVGTKAPLQREELQHSVEHITIPIRELAATVVTFSHWDIL